MKIFAAYAKMFEAAYLCTHPLGPKNKPALLFKIDQKVEKACAEVGATF